MFFIYAILIVIGLLSSAAIVCTIILGWGNFDDEKLEARIKEYEELDVILVEDAKKMQKKFQLYATVSEQITQRQKELQDLDQKLKEITNAQKEKINQLTQTTITENIAVRAYKTKEVSVNE